MTLEQVRDWHHMVATENAARRAICSPNGERWELWDDEFKKQVAMADAIDTHLKAGVKVPDSVIAGALFDFLGFLTSRDDSVTFSSRHDASAAVKAFQEWNANRGIDSSEADVNGWTAVLALNGRDK